MQRKRQQAVTGTESCRCQAAQVKRRAARNNHFGELLPLRLQRRLFINRVLDIGNIEERCAKQLLIVFQVLGRVFYEQPVARLHFHGRQFRKKQGFSALNLVDAKIAIGFRKDLGERLAVGETTFFNV